MIVTVLWLSWSFGRDYLISEFAVLPPFRESIMNE